MVRATSTTKPRPSSPMPIRCSGRLIPSLAMAVYVDADDKGCVENEAECRVRIGCGRIPVLGNVAGDAIDHGGGSQAAAAEGRRRGGQARHHAWPEGGVRLAG